MLLCQEHMFAIARGYERQMKFRIYKNHFIKLNGQYISLMNMDSISEVLDAAICPSDTFSMKDEGFLAKRSELLAQYANSLINSEGAVVE